MRLLRSARRIIKGIQVSGARRTYICFFESLSPGGIHHRSRFYGTYCMRKTANVKRKGGDVRHRETVNMIDSCKRSFRFCYMYYGS